MESCSCGLAQEAKLVYGPWIHIARVPVSPVMIQSNESSPPTFVGDLSSNQWIQPKMPMHKSSSLTARPQADSTYHEGFGSRFHPLMTKKSEDATEVHFMELGPGTNTGTTATNPSTYKDKRKRSPLKANIPNISKGNGFDSPP